MCFHTPSFNICWWNFLKLSHLQLSDVPTAPQPCSLVLRLRDWGSAGSPGTVSTASPLTPEGMKTLRLSEGVRDLSTHSVGDTQRYHFVWNPNRNKSLRWQGRASREAALVGRGSRGARGRYQQLSAATKLHGCPPSLRRCAMGPGRAVGASPCGAGPRSCRGRAGKARARRRLRWLRDARLAGEGQKIYTLGFLVTLKSLRKGSLTLLVI